MRFSDLKKIIKVILLFGSFEGEDRILLRLVPKKGKYLDIGCSTPIKMSNTLLLYLQGWSGICIDARKYRRWKWIRPRDTFINQPIYDISEYKDYDLLDIDVDGVDLDILKTMTYHPRFIIAEQILPMQQGIQAYLESLGYKLVAKTTNNGIYELGESLREL